MPESIKNDKCKIKKTMVVDFNYTTVGLEVTFRNRSKDIPNNSKLLWNFGDGSGNSSTTVPNNTHLYTVVGVYDVTVTITTTDGCVATVTIPGFSRVGTPPVANFSATPLSICFQETVQFTDLTPQPVTGWEWSFGDGGGNNVSNTPSWTYELDTAMLDPFDVRLTAYYNGCPDDTLMQNLITVNAPIPFFTFVQNCTTPLTVPFTNASVAATSYVWNFDDGSATTTATDVNHTFPSSGDYLVNLTATSSATGCVVDTLILVQVRTPSAVITVNDTTVCHGGSIQFSSAGSVDVSTQEWTFGEGIPFVNDTSDLANPSHTYQRPGFYTATLNVTDINGCVVTRTQLIHVLGPTAGFTASPLGGCAPLNVTFTDTSLTEGSAITQWVWNYGIGPDTTSFVGVVSHYYSNANYYGIRLTVTDANGCTDTHFSPNYVNPSSVDLSLLNDTNGCRSVVEVFNANPGTAAGRPVNYSWNFGDGSPVVNDTLNLQTHSFTSNGSYQVYLLAVDNNGCRDSIYKNMFIYTTPAVLSLDTTAACIDSAGVKRAQVQAIFHSDSTAYDSLYSWNLSVLTNITALPDYPYTYRVPPGSYDAFLIVTNELGCIDTSDVVTVIVPGPTGTYTVSPTSGCSPLNVQLTGSATGSNTFAWDFGDGSALSGTSALNVNHNYVTPGTFYPQFFIGFQILNDFCYIPAPLSDSVTVTSDIAANIDSSLICITDGGESSVQVYVDDPTFGPYTYSWNPASFVSDGTDLAGSEGFNLTTSGFSQYFTVAVGYGTQGCAAFDSVLIDYCPCLDDLDSIPNVFTPNGDNVNDFYEMKSLCYFEQFRIIIFNRWGKKMYESNNPGFKWDGRTDGGTEASEGVYYWIMDTRSGQLHGFLELIRK